MNRYCNTCRSHRPLRDFDLGGGQLSLTCIECADARLRSEDQRARNLRVAEITTLEQRHRELVAELVRVDAKLADLRPRARATPLPQPQPRSADVMSIDDAPFGDDVFGSDRSDELS